MNWNIHVNARARKSLERLPESDYNKISNVIEKLKLNSFSFDFRKLKGSKEVWRLRIGNYRLFIKLFHKEKAVFIFNIKRRTSATY